MYVKILLISFLAQICWARIGFMKDQSVDKIDFPPRGLKTIEGIPLGHLRPLGYQRRPDGRVTEKEKLPPKIFYDDFVKTEKPVVFRQLIDSMPATELWTDDYLKKNYGDLDIHVVVKKELIKKGPKVLKFKKFLKEYHYEDWYLTNTIPQEMMKEVEVPPVLTCGLEKYLVESEIWFSSGGTSSLLHAHADHDLHCMLSGRKDFVMINSKHADKLPWIPSEIHPRAGYSKMDVDMVNAFEYENLAKVNWHWAKLKPGDCIFIPAGYLHQVRSYGRSFSTTFHLPPLKNVTIEMCEEKEFNKKMPLHEVPVMWTYTHGDRELTNIKLNHRSLLHHLNLVIRDEESLRMVVFKDFFEEIMSETDAKDHDNFEDIWNKLDPEGKGEVARDQIALLDVETLESVANSLNKRNHSHEPKKPKEEL